MSILDLEGLHCHLVVENSHFVGSRVLDRCCKRQSFFKFKEYLWCVLFLTVPGPTSKTQFVIRECNLEWAWIFTKLFRARVKWLSYYLQAQLNWIIYEILINYVISPPPEVHRKYFAYFTIKTFPDRENQWDGRIRISFRSISAWSRHRDHSRPFWRILSIVQILDTHHQVHFQALNFCPTIHLKKKFLQVTSGHFRAISGQRRIQIDTYADRNSKRNGIHVRKQIQAKFWFLISFGQQHPMTLQPLLLRYHGLARKMWTSLESNDLKLT